MTQGKDIEQLLLEWADILGFYKLSTHTIDNFKSSLEALLTKRVVEELEAVITKGTCLRSDCGIVHEIPKAYIYDRIAALTQKKEQ